MKKTIILSIALVCIALGTSLSSYLTMKENFSSMAIANVEALTDSEGLDCNYIREESKCTIDVGIGGKIRLFGVGILKAGADGTISFDGKLVCSSGGTSSCQPVECVDLYEVIFN